jgi:hypothetical protein
VGRACGGEERVWAREEKTVGPSQKPGMKTMVGLAMAVCSWRLASTDVI